MIRPLPRSRWFVRKFPKKKLTRKRKWRAVSEPTTLVTYSVYTCSSALLFCPRILPENHPCKPCFLDLHFVKNLFWFISAEEPADRAGPPLIRPGPSPVS